MVVVMTEAVFVIMVMGVIVIVVVVVGVIVIVVVTVVMVVPVGMRSGMMMGMGHAVCGLSVIVPRRGKGVDDLAVRAGYSRMRDIGGDDVDAAGSEEIFFAADGHFELSFHHVGDLFMDVVVFGQGCVFADLPKGECACIAVDHFNGKTGKELFYRDVAEVLHVWILERS